MAATKLNNLVIPYKLAVPEVLEGGPTVSTRCRGPSATSAIPSFNIRLQGANADSFTDLGQGMESLDLCKALRDGINAQKI